MKNRNHLNIVWIILFTGLTISCMYLKKQKIGFKIEEIETNIKNPRRILTISDDQPTRNFIIATDQELLFCDSEFSVNNRVNFKTGRAIISKDNKYLITYRSTGERGRSNLSFYDYNGTLLWTKEIFIDEYNNYFRIPSDNGLLYSLDVTPLKLSIYSKTGEILSETKLFEDYKKIPFKELKMEVTKSGNYCIILTEKIPSAPSRLNPYYKNQRKLRTPVRGKLSAKDSIRINEKYTKPIDGESYLFLIDSKGIIIHSKKVEEDEIRALFINDDASLILYTVEDIDSTDNNFTTVLVDMDFNTIFTAIYSFCPAAVLFRDDIIIMAYWDRIENKSSLSSIDKPTGKILWSRRFDKDVAFSINDINPSDNYIEVISQEQRTVSNPEPPQIINIFDLSGNLLLKKEIGFEKNSSILSLNKNSLKRENYKVFDGKINKITFKQ
ncbi:hypothetical protein KKA87_07245 [bacterium]|nr:hypothetical protein [bacterium]MBU1872418.1 hypothetical protein [bacterium]